jgi:CysZ protein
VALLSYFGSSFGDFFHWLSSWVQVWHMDNPDTIWLKTLNFFLWGFTELFRILVFVIGLIFVSISGFVLGMILTSPLNDLLSEKTEAIVRIPHSTPFSLHYLWHLIRGEILKSIFLILVPILILILNLIPLIGTIIYILLSSLFGMWAMGIAYIDYPVSRAQPGFRGRFRFYWQNFSAISGFGVIFFIPVFNFVFSSPLVVGSTLLYLQLTETDTMSL